MSQLIVLLEKDFKNTFKHVRIKRSSFPNDIQSHYLTNSSKSELKPKISTFKEELSRYKDVVEIVAEDIDSDSDDGDSTITFSEETAKKCTELGDTFSNGINRDTKDASFGYKSEKEEMHQSKMVTRDIPYAEEKIKREINSEIEIKQEISENDESLDDADMNQKSIVTKRRKSTNDADKKRKNIKMEQECDSDGSEFVPGEDVEQEDSDDDSLDREVRYRKIRDKSEDDDNPNKFSQNPQKSIITKRRKSTNDSDKKRKNIKMEQERDSDASEFVPGEDVEQEDSDDDSLDREVRYRKIRDKSEDDDNPNKAVIKQLLDKATVYSCTLCDKTVKTDAQKLSHRKSHNLRYLSFKHLYVCPECPFEVNHSHPFRVHYQKNHSDTDGIFEWKRCPECPYKTWLNRNLSIHINHHKEKGPIQCEYCTFSDNTRQRMTVHLKLHNKFRAGIFSCDECSYVTKHAGGLIGHKQVHHTRDEEKKWFKCKECPFKATINGNLKRHIKCHQLNVGYACPHCTYRSPYACRVTDHIKVHFGKNEPVPEYDPKRQTPTYSCQQCQYKTWSKSQLDRHMTAHNRRIKCAECPFTCKDKIHLVSHVTCHNGDGILKCPWCTFTHKFKPMMTKHKRLHIEERQIKKSPTKKFRKGEPRCSICNELFQSQSYVKRHMSKHQTVDEVENPVMCAHCPFRSKYKAKNFITHVHCHFRKDGFKCDFCSFRHDRQNVMTTHIRLHTEALVKAEAER